LICAEDIFLEDVCLAAAGVFHLGDETVRRGRTHPAVPRHDFGTFCQIERNHFIALAL